MSVTHTDVRHDASLEPCGSTDHVDCGLRLVLDRLGEQWTVMTLAELSVGPRRYRELERSLDGISQRMMTLTLRRLERDGHVLRHVTPTVRSFLCVPSGRACWLECASQVSDRGRSERLR